LADQKNDQRTLPEDSGIRTATLPKGPAQRKVGAYEVAKTALLANTTWPSPTKKILGTGVRASPRSQTIEEI